MGQQPSKKMGRTRSKELSANDLADNLKATHIDNNSSSSPPSPIDVSNNNLSTPVRGRKGGRGASGSVSSFNSATSKATLKPEGSLDNQNTPMRGAGSPMPSSTLAPPSPRVPTNTTILASPKAGGLRSSLLGTSPPPSAIGTSPDGRSPSPGPSGMNNSNSNNSLSPGAALTATMSRNSMTASSPGAGLQVLDVDNMIGRLLEAGYSGKVTKSPPLKNAEIASVCAAAREVFLSQPTLIELSPPVKIVGDVHGQVSLHLAIELTIVRRLDPNV